MTSDGDRPDEALTPGRASLHPWLRPLWRRVVVSGVCAVWLVVEAAFGDPFFSVLAVGMCAYAAWDFFIRPARLDRAGRRE